MLSEFKEAVLAVVRAIPRGRVLSYGEVSQLAGRPRNARQVGAILYGLSEEEAQGVPWHRVVSAAGRLSTFKVGTGELQRALLRSEGVAVVNERVALRDYRWRPGHQDDD